MVQSMTGFATTTLALPTASGLIPATLTIKSLNGRFFDITCKLPYALSHLETDIIRRCKDKLHRGSVLVTLYITNPHALKSKVYPSFALAEGYLASIKELQKKLDLPGSITISDFITLPNLFEASEEVNLTNNNALIMETVEQLLDTLITVREQEGQALQKDLEDRIQIMQKAIDALEPRAHLVHKEKQQIFIEELQKAVIALKQELPEAQLQILYNAFEKKDVHEEIVRFKNHVHNFLATLQDNQQQKGKKLDFILQELFREINTFGAKLTTDIQASNSIIIIKGELEKAREQVQNIV